MCFDAGLYMTQAQAEADDGPDVFYVFEGANQGRTDDGSRPNGASGHIVTVVRVRDANGHTIGFYTIEAMGHAYGVVNGSFEGRGWTGFARIPGVLDRPVPPPPPPAPKEIEDMLIEAPPSQQVDSANPAAARLDMTLGTIGLLNGARVKQFAGNSAPVPVAPGAHLIGWYETFKKDGITKLGFNVLESRNAQGHNPRHAYIWDAP
jgi:hypothetical protein